MLTNLLRWASHSKQMRTIVRSGFVPGCIGRIVQMHAECYARNASFGLGFEANVAIDLTEFSQSFMPGRDGLWLAMSPEVQGSIAIDGTHAATEGAHLRWFITSDSLRGQDIG